MGKVFSLIQNNEVERLPSACINKVCKSYGKGEELTRRGGYFNARSAVLEAVNGAGDVDNSTVLGSEMKIFNADLNGGKAVFFYFACGIFNLI